MDQSVPMNGSLARKIEGNTTTEDAVYLALNNELIASQICFHSMPTIGADKHTFTILARTCRGLHLPAIVEIWRNLHGLAPLVMTMPNNCWEIAEPNEINAYQRSIRFIRPISMDDCHRFRFYAKFVHSYHTGTRLPAGDASVYESLYLVMKEHGEICLLPNLETLGWNTQLDSTFPFFTTLLHPYLKDIRITFKDKQCRLDSVKDIAIRCPKLRGVVLRSSDDHTGIAAVSSAYPVLENLDSFSITALSTAAYLQLVEHPSLTELSIQNLATVDWTLVESRPQNFPSFPRLRKILLGPSKMETILHAFKFIDQPPLREIGLVTNDNQGGSAWGHLIRLISATAAGNFHQLEELYFNDKGPLSIDPAVLLGPLTPEHFQPLFSFKHLAEVEIHTYCPIMIDDQCIQRLAESWPNLKRLALHLLKNTLDPEYYPPKNTIHSLIHFATNCPSLSILSLAFDARNPRLPDHTLGNSISSKLSILSIQCSPIGDSQIVAAIFSDWFPQLNGVMCGGFLPMEDRKKWITVSAWLPLLRKVRMQERASNFGRGTLGLQSQSEAGS
ncbi:hypothetical protein BDN72DRAFT_880111, partial [Pluteus cervinus]